MKIPNWMKIVWWGVLVGVLSYFLRERLPDLLSGKTAPADIAVFGVLMALLLAPLFSEVTLFGVTLKNEIEELKGQIAIQIGEVRADIRSAIDVRATVSPTINFPMPPSDSRLPAIEQQVKAAVAAAFQERGIPSFVSAPDVQVSDDVQFLFATRYNLESELRRIASGSPLARRRTQSLHALSRGLVETGSLDPSLARAIEEVNSICAPAIHGEPVSKAQVTFVRDVARDLITALRAIPAETGLVSAMMVTP